MQEKGDNRIKVTGNSGRIQITGGKNNFEREKVRTVQLGKFVG